jgi:hypothetical protein
MAIVVYTRHAVHCAENEKRRARLRERRARQVAKGNIVVGTFELEPNSMRLFRLTDADLDYHTHPSLRSCCWGRPGAKLSGIVRRDVG